MSNTTMISKNLDLSPAPADADFTGLCVRDIDGESVGKVTAVLVDASHPEHSYFEIAYQVDGGPAGSKYLVPLEAITGIDDLCVHIDSRDSMEIDNFGN